MSGHPFRPLIVGVPAGISFVGLALIAHSMAGGRVGVGALVAVSLIAVAVAVALTRVRWTFGRLAFVALGSQPALHVALGHNAPTHHMAHGGAGHDHLTIAAATHGGHVSMVVAHVLLACATAVLIRWGHCWLRAFPDIGRAVLMAGRGAISVVAPRPTYRAPTSMAFGPAPLAVLLTWGMRGPPGAL